MSAETDGECHGPAERPTGESSIWTLAMVRVATLMLLLEMPVVSVALPEIRRSIGSGFSSGLQW